MNRVHAASMFLFLVLGLSTPHVLAQTPAQEPAPDPPVTVVLVTFKTTSGVLHTVTFVKAKKNEDGTTTVTIRDPEDPDHTYDLKLDGGDVEESSSPDGGERSQTGWKFKTMVKMKKKTT